MFIIPVMSDWHGPPVRCDLWSKGRILRFISAAPPRSVMWAWFHSAKTRLRGAFWPPVHVRRYYAEDRSGPHIVQPGSRAVMKRQCRSV